MTAIEPARQLGHAHSLLIDIGLLPAHGMPFATRIVASKQIGLFGFLHPDGCIMKRSKSKAGLATVATVIFGLVSTGASAAPFCLTSQTLPPSCIYYDAQDCARDAQHQNATCSANAAEVTLSHGFGQFCVVTSAKVSVCSYADRQTCAVDAQRLRGTCVAAPTRAFVGAPDPYSDTDGR